MKREPSQPQEGVLSAKARRSGSALLVTLLMLSLITIIVVAFLATMTWSISAAHRDYENQKARGLAIMGMNGAVAQLRSALGTWDNPYANFTNTPPTFYWSISPGILTRWSYTNTAPLTNYPLFSIGSTNLVNLNAVTGDGTYPIAGITNTAVAGATPPNISVYWVNVLRFPNLATGINNPLVGRYAFWVDDENAKININTADGTLKYQTNSLGLGTPGEVSLQALQSGGANISTQVATNIVYQARTTGFNSTREILRVAGSTPDIYTNNVFNLTTSGRSPELNIFGEPKINLIAASITTNTLQGSLQLNTITGQNLTEIYPTPNQLPPFKFKDANRFFNASDPWRPQVFSQAFPIYPYAYFNSGNQYGSDGDGYVAALISTYLGSTNSMGKAIQWPVFPTGSGGSSGSQGFLGKYSLRQLDSLSAQIMDLGGKAISPDWTNLASGTRYPFTIPANNPGLLSHELVPGLGRTAKINEILMKATVTGQQGVIGSGGSPPYLQMDIYVETYLPAGFAGVDLLNLNNGLPPVPSALLTTPSYELGGGPTGGVGGGYAGSLNVLDMPQSVSTGPLNVGGTNGFFPYPVNASYPAIIPRQSSQPLYSTQPNNYWQDTLLQNNQGIDFVGNDSAKPDPDQIRAAFYHPYALTNGLYNGTGPGLGASPMLEMGYLSAPATAGYNGSGTKEWYPGQYRTVENDFPSTAYKMMTNGPSSLVLSGGLVVTGFAYQRGEYDPDPTPFDAGVRGQSGSGSQPFGSYTTESFANNVWEGSTGAPGAWAAVLPGNASQTTYPSFPTERVFDRMTNGLIPVNLTIPIPALNSLSPNIQWYHAEVADPLVNKFPADWITSSSPSATMGAGSAPPTITSSHPGNSIGGYALYYNGDGGQNAAATTSTYQDPDSFWMPTLDPNIPNSARMPNIGYLNYLRTGVIPDDTTVPLAQQHGFPYRCLNFNALSDASQMGATNSYRATGYYYPDWALLDLFTIPSTLLPYHGPYGFYETNGVWTPGSIMTGNPTNMYNYGTYGGSTPGRINPNGSVIYTTNVSIPTPGITRTVPLQALVHGLMVNQTISSGASAATATAHASTFTGGTMVNDTNLASAIATYIAANGPLREPAEICNVPAVAANVAVGFDSTHKNPTRNDLVRQIVGNLTTQSNTFSVWVAGQSVNKIKTNTNYALFEAGDQITGSIRYHFIVERYLDLGPDGIVGNPSDGGHDKVVGTFDDPVNTPYHPPNPRYLYRVIYAEEIRN